MSNGKPPQLAPDSTYDPCGRCTVRHWLGYWVPDRHGLWRDEFGQGRGERNPTMALDPAVKKTLISIASSLARPEELSPGEYFMLRFRSSRGRDLGGTPMVLTQHWWDTVFVPLLLDLERMHVVVHLVRVFRNDVQVRSTMTLPAPVIRSNSGNRASWPLPKSSMRGLLNNLRSRNRRRRSRLSRPLTVGSNLRPSPEASENTFLRGYVSWTDESQSLETVPYASYVRTWSGSRTPGFGRKRRGSLPNNSHSVNLRRVSINNEYRRETRFDLEGDLASDITVFDRYRSQGFAPAEPFHNDSAYDKALKRLLDRSNGMSANLAQDFAQVGMTVNLISDAARRIAGAGRDIKRGNILGAVQTLWRNGTPRFKRGKEPNSFAGDAASNWLALQYGWKPLLQSVQGSMEALARYNLADYSVQKVSASATAKSESVLSHATNDISPTALGETKFKSRTQVKIGVSYRYEDKLLAFLGQTGFTNPLNLAWEILPFSFVADWFLPIGPYLETLSAWHGLTFLDGFITRYTEERVTGAIYFSGQLNINVGSPGLILNEYAGAYRRTWVKLDRTKLNSFPSARPPRFKNPFSVTHALNAVALVQQVFGGKR